MYTDTIRQIAAEQAVLLQEILEDERRQSAALGKLRREGVDVPDDEFNRIVGLDPDSFLREHENMRKCYARRRPSALEIAMRHANGPEAARIAAEAVEYAHTTGCDYGEALAKLKAGAAAY
jgi:hypothetical protein